MFAVGSSILPHKQPQQHHVVAVSLGQQVHYGNSPQRRFLSESELVRQANASNAKTTGEFSYARSNNTMDNIRELAGSPQRSIYMWKDSSPGFQSGVSNSGPVMVDYNMGAVSSNSGPVTSSIGHSSSDSGGGMPGCGVHYNAMVSSSDNGSAQFVTVNCDAQHSHSLIMTHSRLHHQIASSANDYLQSPQQASIVQRSNPASPTTMSSSSMGTASNYMMRYGNNNAATHQQPNTSYVQTIVNSSANNTSSGHIYQPKLHGGVAVFPPSAITNSGNLNTTQLSPQIKRKQMPTRPMSFVRALEMTDSMEMQTLDHQQQQNRNNGAIRAGQSGNLTQHLGAATSGSSTSNINVNNSSNNNNTNNSSNNNKNLTAISDRASVYDMNYEISV